MFAVVQRSGDLLTVIGRECPVGLVSISLPVTFPTPSTPSTSPDLNGLLSPSPSGISESVWYLNGLVYAPFPKARLGIHLKRVFFVVLGYCPYRPTYCHLYGNHTRSQYFLVGFCGVVYRVAVFEISGGR